MKYVTFPWKLYIDNRILFLVVLGFSLGLFFIRVDVFLDDVFIYLRVAENIAGGNGPVLNPGDSHFPVTSPLWVFLLGFLHKIFGFIDLMLLSKIVFTLLLGFASYLGFACLRPYIGGWAALIPLPVFFNYITLTTVGGEIALVYLSLFGVLWSYFIKKNFFYTGMWGAVAYLSRGEAVLLLVPVVLHYILGLGQKEKSRFTVRVKNIAKIAFTFLLIVSIWHIYYAVQFHSLFPNTLEIKRVQGESGMWPLYYQKGRAHALEILGGHYFWVFFLLFGLLYFRGISLSLLGYTVLHYYTYKFLTIPNYHWYFYDFYLLIPIFTLFGLVAFFLFLSRLVSSLMKNRNPVLSLAWPSKVISTLIVLMALLACILQTTRIDNLSPYNRTEDDRFTRYSRAASWVKKQLHRGDILLGPEIGILGYLLPDCCIRDVNGIASPGVTVGNINRVEYFVDRYKPRFIFFPPWESHKHDKTYFVFNRNLYIYSKGYEVVESGFTRESVFLYAGHTPVSADLEILRQLKDNSHHPGIDYTRLNRGYALSFPLARAFISQLEVPDDARGFSIRLALADELKGESKGNCCLICRIEGIEDRQKILLWREELKPKTDNGGEKISVSFPLQSSHFDYLHIKIKAKHMGRYSKKDVNGKPPVIALYNPEFLPNYFLYSTVINSLL